MVSRESYLGWHKIPLNICVKKEVADDETISLMKLYYIEINKSKRFLNKNLVRSVRHRKALALNSV